MEIVSLTRMGDQQCFWAAALNLRSDCTSEGISYRLHLLRFPRREEASLTCEVKIFLVFSSETWR